jgi:phage terminase small subunit
MHDPSRPLSNPRHEAFARAIAQGHRLAAAYERAGFTGKSRRLSWQLRHRPEVEARIVCLLQRRIDADTKAYRRREKKDEDLRHQVIEELKRIAFADVREVVNWKPEPVLSPDGEVLEIVDRISVTASDMLTPGSAAAIKGVSTKSGAVRLEMHDKQAALLALAKHLRLFEDPQPPSPSVTVNQVNVGETNSFEAIRKVAFMLGALRAREAERIDNAPPQGEPAAAETKD